jgi:hypothetical protein
MMLDKFIAACEAWQRVTDSPWLSGPMGTLNGIYFGAMLCLFWAIDPIVAAGTVVAIAFAARFLGWTRAFIVGNLLGAASTVVVVLTLFPPH